MILARARIGGRPCLPLLAGGNWNNSTNTGVSYRNTNNTVSNSNRNISTHVELRYRPSGPEQRTGQSPDTVGAEHTTDPQEGASTRLRTVGRSLLSAGLGVA
jgi:hypothetical protein